MTVRASVVLTPAFLAGGGPSQQGPRSWGEGRTQSSQSPVAGPPGQVWEGAEQGAHPFLGTSSPFPVPSPHPNLFPRGPG